MCNFKDSEKQTIVAFLIPLAKVDFMDTIKTIQKKKIEIHERNNVIDKPENS